MASALCISAQPHPVVPAVPRPSLRRRARHWSLIGRAAQPPPAYLALLPPAYRIPAGHQRLPTSPTLPAEPIMRAYLALALCLLMAAGPLLASAACSGE